jgi:hypothetical protein
VAHLTSKNTNSVQCLCGENIFTLARKVVFSGFQGGKIEGVNGGLINVYRGGMEVLNFGNFGKM